MSRPDSPEEVTQRLRELRRQAGADFKPYFPVDVDVPISEEIENQEELLELMHVSGLLVKMGQPVFAYIRDHTMMPMWMWRIKGGPRAMRKLHFSVCQTLLEMKEKGRFQRYRVTNSKADTYAVDTKDETGADVRLLPCQNCLAKLRYKCFSYSMQSLQRRRIVTGFNSTEAMSLMRQWFAMFQMDIEGLRTAQLPTGYTHNWREISQAYKAQAGYECANCGVHLNAAKHRRFLDTHHISGDKRDNDASNLKCLCKTCHSAEHPHYRIPPDDLRALDDIRQRQQLSDGA